MIRETPNSPESPPPDEEGANEHSAASANFAVAAFYEIEALGKHLLAKFGTKYYVGTVVATNLGKESSATHALVCARASIASWMLLCLLLVLLLQLKKLQGHHHS